jgi:hypothetical protein
VRGRSSKGSVTTVALAVAVILLVGAAGYLYVAKSGALSRTDSLDSVVVVFASRAEDGAEVGQVVAQVTDDGRSVRLLDPRQTATIPGTSYDKLGDAYPFGGGKAVADALAGDGGTPIAYVDVPEAEWIALLDRRGTVSVDVPRALEVFDGKKLVSFAEGTQTVAAADVPALLRGAAYLETADRMRVVEAVGEASVSALAAQGAPAGARVGVRTDLTAEAYARLLAGLGAR